MTITIKLYMKEEDADTGEMVDMSSSDLRDAVECIREKGEVCGYAIDSVRITND